MKFLEKRGNCQEDETERVHITHTADYKDGDKEEIEVASGTDESEENKDSGSYISLSEEEEKEVKRETF